MNFRYKVGLVVFVLGSVFALGRCGGRSTGPKATLPAVLPSNDKEQIIVDPSRHRLTIVRPDKTQVLTLPDHPSVIDIHKDGSVYVTSPQFGFERRFFAGLQGSDAFRVAAGIDGVYWKRLDVGVGVAGQIGSYTPIVFAQVSYNVYGNIRAALTYDNRRHIGGSLTVRLF